MASKAKLIVTGIKEVDAALRALGSPKEANKASRRAMREVLKTHILPEVRREAPVETGHLEESPTVRAGRRSRSRVEFAVVIGIDRFGRHWYPTFKQFGAPGINQLADPFMTRAYEHKKDAARADAERIWRDQIEAAAKRLRKS